MSAHLINAQRIAISCPVDACIGQILFGEASETLALIRRGITAQRVKVSLKLFGQWQAIAACGPFKPVRAICGREYRGKLKWGDGLAKI